MKFGSLSKCIYTDEQYEKCSTKHCTLTMSLLTILMLFFMAKPTYMTDTPLLHVAGISGLVYAVLSAIDALVRPCLSEIRIFDELSVVAAYVCLWALMGMIFNKICFWSLIIVTCVFVIVGFVLALIYDPNPDDPNLGKIQDKQTRDFVAALSENNHPAAANALTTMALFALFTKPDEPLTKALVEAARAVIEAAPAPAAPNESPCMCLCC